MNRHSRGPIVVALVMAVALLLTACTPSPKTLYVGADGKNVTVDWADYPGQAGVDAAEVLLAPSAEDVRGRSALIMGELERRVSEEFGVAWENGPTGTEERDEPRYGGTIYPNGGNGYGRESLYVTYNAISRETLSIPTSVHDWNRIQDIINDVVQAHGLGELTSDGLVDYWQWSGTAYGESQWLYASLVDVERDGTGKALEDMKGSVDYGWNSRAITISYGATVLPASDREIFVKRLAPFEGLTQPNATSSD